MNKRVCGLITAALLLGAAPAYSQQLGGTNPDSKMLGTPEAANTGSMSGLYSPNLYDGSANINIPVYDYRTDAGQFGVSLGYNTRGVRVDELASSVGLHWNLIAEGSIQRVVKGLPDELNAVYPDTLWMNGAVKYNRFKGRLGGSFDNSTEMADPLAFRDPESDDFIVSAGGLSFTFNIGTGRQIYTNPNRNFQVALLSSGQPYSTVVQNTGTTPDPLTLEFLVTDLSGNQYHFVRGDYDYISIFAEMDAFVSSGIIANHNQVSRWVVDEVTLADGRKIRYNYYDKNGSATIYKSYAAAAGSPGAPGAGVTDKGEHIAMIRSIEYPNAVTAHFVYDSTKGRCDYGKQDYPQINGMALREVRIQSGDNCTRYQMDQSYTVVVTGSNTTSEIAYGSNCISIGAIPANRSHRLRLKGINMVSCDGSVTEPLYTFTYDPVALPLRFSGSQDYFGYYNARVPQSYSGSSEPDLSIPYHTVSGSSVSYGVDRSEHPSYTMAGLLTEIQNGYGGKIAFSYGAHSTNVSPLLSLPAHDYYFGAGGNDGVRLEAITESDVYHPGNQKHTTFAYYDGQRFLDGGFFHYSRSMAGIGGYTGTMTSTFVTPHQFVNGSNHGYSRVVMTAQDENGQMLSKKEVGFTNFSDSLSGYQPRYLRVGGGKHFYEFPYTDKQYLRDWEMGLLLYSIDYDQDGHILEKMVNSYSFAIDSTTAVNKGVTGAKVSFLMDSSQPPLPSSVTGYNFAVPRGTVTDPYKPFNGVAQLTNTTTYKYFADNEYVTDAISYSYDGHKNLQKTVTLNSQGEEIQTIQYYNYDVEVLASLFLPFPGLEVPVASQRWKRVAAGDMPQNGVLLDGYFSGMSTPSQPKNQYQLTSVEPLSYSQYLGTGDDNTTAKKARNAFRGDPVTGFQKISEVTLADARSNVLETQLMDQDQYKAMIWDTLSGQKLAEAANCRYNDIAYSSFEASQQGNWHYDPAYIVAGATIPGAIAMTGKKVLKMLNGSADQLYVSSLSPGTSYKITFWCRGGTPQLAGGGIGTIPLTITGSPGNGWSFYEATFTPATNAAVGFAVTGSPSAPFTYYLDDVRLHPATAVMQSQTYEPLFGISSSTDARGRITYYEYDKMGRQNLIRNQEGHILSKTQYTIKGAE